VAETGGIGPPPKLPRTGGAPASPDNALPIYILFALSLICVGSALRKLNLSNVRK